MLNKKPSPSALKELVLVEHHTIPKKNGKPVAKKKKWQIMELTENSLGTELATHCKLERKDRAVKEEKTNGKQSFCRTLRHPQEQSAHLEESTRCVCVCVWRCW